MAVQKLSRGMLHRIMHSAATVTIWSAYQRTPSTRVITLLYRNNGHDCYLTEEILYKA